MSNRAMWMALAVAAVGAAGCGPAPYATSPEPEQQVVYVVSPPRAPAAEPVDSSPFAAGQVWSGSYVCPQGRTALRLIIVHADGDRLEAIFDFHHAPSGARGSYVIRGSRDAETGHVAFSPDRWIMRPEHYVMVGMEGSLSAEDRRLTGHITHPDCGDFDVSR